MRYRIVTFFTGHSLPAFLITVFGKGERSNLTKSERNALAALSMAALSKTMVAEYRNRAAELGARQ